MRLLDRLVALKTISKCYAAIIEDISVLTDDPEYEEVFFATEKAYLEALRIKLGFMKKDVDDMAKSMAFAQEELT